MRQPLQYVAQPRIQVAALPELARLLSNKLEELFGQQQETTVRKRGPTPATDSR
ncbi:MULTISPECIES: hypothetical protein [Pseudomonas]|uniref:hypothetical protein n=1 Tax=Pseudomonas mosselii TaxID=78327 RepID=UPI0014871109|nr:hypothetical protein [Pseudomonas mosselii]